MPSFDTVLEPDLVELRNAVEQANKELGTRFDFKGSDARVEQAELVLTVFADNEFQLGQVQDVVSVSAAAVAVDTARQTVDTVIPEKEIRNTPLLVQIFFLYFVTAPLFDLGRTTTAILALSLFEGAYASEIFRAGITSIGRGQWEACYSLGLSRSQSYRHVVLPQALRRILPPLTSQAVSLIKDSALVSTIAVADLTMQGRMIVAETFLSFEIWFVVAAIYLTLTLALSGLAHSLERRFPRIT